MKGQMPVFLGHRCFSSLSWAPSFLGGLLWTNSVMLVNEDSANTEIEKSEKIVALFFARWCPYCKAFKPVFERYASTSDQDFAAVDISDEESDLWEKYEIHIVPTLIAFSHGKIVARKDGRAHVGLSESDLRDLIEEIQD